MPRGAPDDSNVVKQGAVYRLDDQAELAARLGSVVNYHRFGDVVYIDNFEGGLNGYQVSTNGLGGYARVTNDYAAGGNIAIVLNTGTGSDPYIAMWRGIPVPASYYLGFSFYFMITAGAGTVQCQLSHFTGSQHWLFLAQYDHRTGEVSVRDTDGAWYVLGTITKLVEAQGIFHIIKVTVDLYAGTFDKVYVNEKVFDARPYGPVLTFDTSAPYFRGFAYFTADGAGSIKFYLDNWVMTQNELQE